MNNERLLSEQEIYDIIARLDVAKFQSEGIVWPLFEAQDAKSIAARDKWWAKTVDALMNEPPCYAPDIEPCTELNCEVYPCAFMKWQSLKQSLGVKQ